MSLGEIQLFRNEGLSTLDGTRVFGLVGAGTEQRWRRQQLLVLHLGRLQQTNHWCSGRTGERHETSFPGRCLPLFSMTLWILVQ